MLKKLRRSPAEKRSAPDAGRPFQPNVVTASKKFQWFQRNTQGVRLKETKHETIARGLGLKRT